MMLEEVEKIHILNNHGLSSPESLDFLWRKFLDFLLHLDIFSLHLGTAIHNGVFGVHGCSHVFFPTSL